MNDLPERLERLYIDHGTNYVQEAAREIRNHRAHAATPCTWQQDGDSDSDAWGTTCGHYFRLDDGTPTDNKMKFCCYCGKTLVSSPIEPDEEPA